MTRRPLVVHHEEERDHALADLAELEAQVSAGEIDPETAANLRRRYEAAAADAIRAIEAAETTAGPNRRRVLAGVAAFVVVAAVITITLIAAVEPRPDGGFVTGGVASDVVDEASIDLDAVSNEEMEAVVAANPEILPMRLALARRYVEVGQFSEALDHYLYVLERRTDPEALMYVGWMTYLSDDAATGVTLLEESLQVRPGDAQAQWFLANALYFGLGETDRAIELLEEMIDSGLAPDEIIVEANRMIEEATR